MVLARNEFAMLDCHELTGEICDLEGNPDDVPGQGKVDNPVYHHEQIVAGHPTSPLAPRRRVSKAVLEDFPSDHHYGG